MDEIVYVARPDGLPEVGLTDGRRHGRYRALVWVQTEAHPHGEWVHEMHVLSSESVLSFAIEVLELLVGGDEEGGQ